MRTAAAITYSVDLNSECPKAFPVSEMQTVNRLCQPKRRPEKAVQVSSPSKQLPLTKSQANELMRRLSTAKSQSQQLQEFTFYPKINKRSRQLYRKQKATRSRAKTKSQEQPKSPERPKSQHSTLLKSTVKRFGQLKFEQSLSYQEFIRCLTHFGLVQTKKPIHNQLAVSLFNQCKLKGASDVSWGVVLQVVLALLGIEADKPQLPGQLSKSQINLIKKKYAQFSNSRLAKNKAVGGQPKQQPAIRLLSVKSEELAAGYKYKLAKKFLEEEGCYPTNYDMLCSRKEEKAAKLVESEFPASKMKKDKIITCEFRYLEPKGPPPEKVEQQFSFTPLVEDSARTLAMALHSKSVLEMKPAAKHEERMRRAAEQRKLVKLASEKGWTLQRAMKQMGGMVEVSGGSDTRRVVRQVVEHKAEIESERTPVLYVDVSLQSGELQRIVVYENDTAEGLAAKFREEHGLDETKFRKLLRYLEQYLGTLLPKIRQEEESHL